MKTADTYDFGIKQRECQIGGEYWLRYRGA